MQFIRALNNKNYNHCCDKNKFWSQVNTLAMNWCRSPANNTVQIYINTSKTKEKTHPYDNSVSTIALPLYYYELLAVCLFLAVY